MGTFSHSIWARFTRLALPVALITCILFGSGSKPSAFASTQINIYGPPGSGAFGKVTVLPTGNFIVVDEGYDAPGPVLDVGAAYLYNGATGALISTLTGSTTGDFNYYRITILTGGNYLLFTYQWDNGAVVDAGAATWGNGVTGVSGVISAANSLVGSTTGDWSSSGGFDFFSLHNGNYVILNGFWDNGPVVDAGAVTWMNGMTGITGEISATNSLVGSTADDKVGLSTGLYLGDACVTVLRNGNYVVGSTYWDNGAAGNAGAVTWANGMTGVSGEISVDNSLVGGTEGASLGFTSDNIGGKCGVTALRNGNYVIASEYWNTGTAGAIGAVTWGNGTTGIRGVASAENSLVGSTAEDRVGYTWYGVVELSNGNYVVLSPLWDNGAIVDAGAVTFASGTTGLSGEISAANSLVGSQEGDKIGFTYDSWLNRGNVVALANGNYVVISADWDNGAVMDAGAVTWGNGTSGVIGPVTAANSLVGSTAGDRVGFSDQDSEHIAGVEALSNGNYLVMSRLWDNGAGVNAGAVTWGDGTKGISGEVSTANSLVGTPAGDLYYDVLRVVALANGNYLVRNTYWDNGASIDAGAVTWGDGTLGVSGLVSAANSLVGTTDGDHVGSYDVLELTNGNYVVRSPTWDNGAAVDAGAVTWGSGTLGVRGEVSAANSLVGSTAGDYFGASVATALAHGNYVVGSPHWQNGSVVNAGAVTWGNGASGTSGVVSADNSLVGSTADDKIGYNWVTALANGNYVVGSPQWHNGSVVDAGAVTWGNGANGTSGVVSADNSLVGIRAGDQVGSSWVNVLSNGTYVFGSPHWHNGQTMEAGALTWGNGTAALSGVLSAANSLVGSTLYDRVGGGAVLRSGDFVLVSPDWDNGKATDSGAVTFFSGKPCAFGLPVGPITAITSVLGTAEDGGRYLNFAFDSVHQQLVVGRPADNMVSLFLPSACVYHTFIAVIGN